MAGATSSEVHAVTTETARGARRRLVLRRYVNRAWLAREPDLAEHEARVLSLLASTDVRAPQLVAVDATGASCDVPAVLMTRLAGRLRRRPDLRQLAEVLPVVHAVRVPPGVRVRPYSPYYLDRDLRPPAWARRPAVWERANEVPRGPPPDDPAVFVHRDYHPGNVPWSGGQVIGLVDWVNASIGGAGGDVGHCRSNLCDLGLDVA